jgi:hypothetical protein
VGGNVNSVTIAGVARLVADAYGDGTTAVLLLTAQLAAAASHYGDRAELDRRMFNALVRSDAA